MKERPIAFYAEIARELKSINAAIFYQQIRYWSDKGSREDGWIYKTSTEIERETTLTEDKQRICKRILVQEKEWLEAKKIMHKGSMVWHYRLLVDFTFSIVPTGKIPVATMENPSSTTMENPSSSIQRIPETTTGSRNSRTVSSSDVEKLTERLPNTAKGRLPDVYGQPPLVIKEAKRIERAMSGLYDQTFGKKAKTIVEYFCELYLKKYGRVYGKITKIEPVARTLSTYFRDGETVESIKEMLDAYFISEKANTLALKLTTALSEDTYRLWTQGKLGVKDGGSSVYPMRIGSLVANSDKELEAMYKNGLIVSIGHGKWAPSGKEVRV